MTEKIADLSASLRGNVITRDNYQRLVEIKRKYDPNNFFRINQNIKPD